MAVVVGLLVVLLHLLVMGWLPLPRFDRPSDAPRDDGRRVIMVSPVVPSPAPPPRPTRAQSSPRTLAEPSPTRTAPPTAQARRPAPLARRSDTARPLAPSPAPSTPAVAAAPSPEPPLAAASPSEGLASAEPGPAPGAGTGGSVPAPLPPLHEAPLPAQLPASVRLSYAATAQMGATPLQGVFGELTWRQDGEQYQAGLTLRFLFKTLREQRSAGRVGPAGIEPSLFADIRRGAQLTRFERDQGRIAFDGRAAPVPLMAGAQDRLSVVMQIGALLAANPERRTPGQVLAVQTAGSDDAELWLFRVEGRDDLLLPAGEFAAIRLLRGARKPDDDEIELWVAPAAGWLPVRIRQTQANGNSADLQLRGLERLSNGN